ncbi:glycosyltransferase family 4 protein [Methanosphaera sp.]
MKIAFIYDTAYPWVTGGAERRIFEIGKRLALKGHDIHIFSLGFWMNSKEFDSQDTITYEGITYHSVGNPMELYTEDNTRSIKEAIYYAWRVLTHANLSDFDIVDCQGFPYFSCYSSLLRTLTKKTNLVITLHEVWNDYWYEYMGKKGIFGKIIEKGIFYLTNNVICVSQLTYRNMLQNKEPNNTSIIGNGVNINNITYLNASDSYCDVLYAGRLIPEKHVDLLIKAMRQVVKVHPYAKCFIVGEGPMEADLKEMVNSLHLENNVFFKGFYDNQVELYGTMKSSSVFVLPSKREGFGIVAIEANACGVPVITIDSPLNASKDLITSDNGWVIKDNYEELADLINKLISNEISSKTRDDCRHYAKKYDWNHITSLTEEYYSDILENK